MHAPDTDLDLACADLGPLAWVLDELRKSLDGASSALRRFVRDTAHARAAEGGGPADAGQLRIARQQLHQAVGALEMVDLPAPAQVLRAMESAVQAFIAKPELCAEAAAAKVERCGFALAEFLEALLLGRRVSAVALFPQYRDVLELAGAERVHPADLWTLDWRWQEPAVPEPVQALGYAPAVRSRMDQSVLRIVKSGDAAAARELSGLCHGLSGAARGAPRNFWKVCAGYFEACALALLPTDVYVKRAASRVLVQYAQLAKGEANVSDRLAQDLVFFCAQAEPVEAAAAPLLDAVRQAWRLERFPVADWRVPQFGRFDPVQLAQVRKRVAAVREAWSALVGGDTGKLRNLGEQFRQLGDALTRLHAPMAPLAEALAALAEGVARSGQAPGPELAMETATAVLYLEAAFHDLDPDDSQLAARAVRLGERLERVRQGGAPEPLEPWIEDLYRRVSDRQTMGSVVGELRVALGELEKDLDAFFRDPLERQPLLNAPGRLSQMRGVLSVLGLDQAAQAVLRMREGVEAMLLREGVEPGRVESLGNNLGALGFLIDMLHYQPTLAKKLFVYDDAAGELRPVMGRTAPPVVLARPAETKPMVAAAAPAFPLPLPPQAEPVRPPTDEAEGAGTVQGEPSAGTATPVAQSQASSEAIDFAAFAFEPPSELSSGASHAAEAAPVAAAAPADVAADAAIPAEPAGADAADGMDDELLSIFLEEAREVVQAGLAAVQALSQDPADLGELTTLRRAFHTLKGSSRMVGLDAFGDAGWAMEQVLNAWLAEQKPASAELRTLAERALQGFGRWADDIAAHADGAWSASAFTGPAEAFRLRQELQPLVFPGADAAQPEPVLAVEPDWDDAEIIELSGPPGAEAPDVMDPEAEPASEPGPLETEDVERRGQVVSSAAIESVESVDAVDAVDAVEAIEPLPQDAPLEPHESAPVVALVEPPAVPDLPPRTAALPLDLSRQALLAGLAAQPPLGDALESIEPGSETGDDPVGEPALEEPVKVIGNLRIGIPLYNVFLNEADEWSRRLQTEVSEWALQLTERLPDSTVALAHSLAGSSATVGFEALSAIARALEHSMQRTQDLAWGTDQHGSAYVDAAEEIRRLLHQFAAGFLKAPDPAVTEALRVLDLLDIPRRPSLADDSVLPPLDDAQPLQAREAADALPPPLHAPAGTRPVDSPVASEAPVTPSLDEEREGIDVADAIDADLFPVFEDEAGELLPQLGGALRQWSARPENRSARDEVLRALHTLKGSARLAGALRLGERAHRMESLIEQLGDAGLVTGDLEPLLQRFDALQACFDEARATAAAPPPALAEVPAPEVAGPAALPEAVPATLPVPTPRTALAPPVTTSVAHQRAVASQAVRVRSQLLDRLMNQAGEVMITRSRLENELRQLRTSLSDLTGNLDRLRSQLRDIELQAESQMQSRLAQAKDSAIGFDPLEFDRFTRVQELTRMMAESVNDVATVQRTLQRTVEATEDDLAAQARQTRELQRDLLRTRMVEFEAIADRLYRVVRQASKDTGKQVRLDIEGGSIEMDRGVLDRMTPAFEHLLRNCVAHGIEDPAGRAAAGKEPSGRILVQLRQEGNDISVEFQDDGAGLDLARIRERALQLGLLRPGQVLSDDETAQLIFTAGFSTAQQVTELAGRGIGMDVVRSEVQALGGRIETSTVAGRGSRFQLVLPLTTAVTQVVMIRSGRFTLGVPANLVEIVRRASAREVQQAYNAGSFEHESEQVPFFWSGALLQDSRRSSEPQGRSLPVVVFRSAAQRVAVHVDEVLGHQEVVVKNLGPQLVRLPGLAGMTVLASGAVVLIYNPVALATVYGEQARALSADEAQPHMLEQRAAGTQLPVEAAAAEPQVPLVLVVDDSITVRRVTQRLLQREGYRVALAVDGLQALERLAQERPALVLSDIEMPRMDGFDLARNIRTDERWADLPIVMITSRIAQKHRDHAAELGVNHYLGKPYSEEELLSLVRRYCAVAAA